MEKLDVEFLCEDCRVYRPYFDRAASALRFNGDARRMLLDFKFNRHLWLRTDFADWLEGVTRARFHVDEIDLIAPVPTTWRHRWLRGYNQTDYLASALAARLEKPCQRRLLRRIGSPARQGGLSEEERRTNVKGTFAVAKPTLVRGKTVLVVDDVMTTGSTLSECARVLKVAGAARVWCVSLARSFRF